MQIGGGGVAGGQRGGEAPESESECNPDQTYGRNLKASANNSPIGIRLRTIRSSSDAALAERNLPLAQLFEARYVRLRNSTPEFGREARPPVRVFCSHTFFKNIFGPVTAL